MVFICVCLKTEICLHRERAALPVSASQEVESVHGHRLYRTHSTSGHRDTHYNPHNEACEIFQI